MQITNLAAREIQIGLVKAETPLPLNAYTEFERQIEQNALCATSRYAHDQILKVHKGEIEKYADLQEEWFAKLDPALHSIFFEPGRKREEMYKDAFEELQLSEDSKEKMIVVGAQAVQDPNWASAPSSTLLDHINSPGTSLTVSQAGVLSGYQAVEVGYHLCRSEGTERFLVLAGDIWPREHPRLLGSFANISDGVAIANVVLDQQSEHNNVFLAVAPVFDAYCSDCSREGQTSQAAAEVLAAFDLLLESASIKDAELVFVATPGTALAQSLRIPQAVKKRGFRIAEGSSLPLVHFGTADFLFRLHDLVAVEGVGCAWVLIWDLDVSGALAVMLVETDIFKGESEDLSNDRS